MTSHDPTTLNRQGGDSGTQYRSIVLYHVDEQKEIAEKVFQEVQSVYADPIVTQLNLLKCFMRRKIIIKIIITNQEAGYCQFVIDPKVQT